MFLGLVLLASGSLWAFFPEPWLELTGIAADDALSRNMLKTDMGKLKLDKHIDGPLSLGSRLVRFDSNTS